MQYFVNVYTVDKAYGGPEEGGWWYDEGSQGWTWHIYDNESDADVTALSLNRRRGGPIHEYETARVETHKPADWPEHRPYDE